MQTLISQMWFRLKRSRRPWQDSNLQSSDPKSDALSIRPHGQWANSPILFTHAVALNKMAFPELELEFYAVPQNSHGRNLYK